MAFSLGGGELRSRVVVLSGGSQRLLLAGVWWTRSHKLRTVAQVLIEAEFTQPVETPVYQSIATRVAAMCDRGVRVSATAKHFGVDHHTVDKALRWFLVSVTAGGALDRNALRSSWTGPWLCPSVDGSNPAICGHRKSGHFRRPETGVEFYFTASCVGKVVWTLVRQLRGPHLSMWA